jgi:hypothetical protein
MVKQKTPFWVERAHTPAQTVPGGIGIVWYRLTPYCGNPGDCCSAKGHLILPPFSLKRFPVNVLSFNIKPVGGGGSDTATQRHTPLQKTQW